MVLLVGVSLGPVQFDTPIWLWLIPVLWLAALWIGRKSLSGLGTTTRRVALVVRLLVIALLAGAMAEPQWKEKSEDVAVTVVLDSSKSVSPAWQARSDQYVQEARRQNKRTDDLLGIVAVAEQALVQSLPSKLTTVVEKQLIGSAEGTNLAAALRLALALKRPDSAYRIVLITDGNQTQGSLLQAAEAAKAAGVPVDVLPITYAFDNEIVADQLVAPATARMGENINVKVVLTATRPARGRLNILLNREPVDLDPDSPSLGMEIGLVAGSNVFSVPITAARSGPQQFEAIFEPAPGPGGVVDDAIQENNRALAVTFVTGDGKVLVVSESTEDAEALVQSLSQARVATDVVDAEQFPASLTALNAYDAIVLINQPAYNFSQQSQEDLRQYVHDTGGGLVMFGGPESFGAGGWIGSPIEDALPIRLDPPQKRQMPRGALVLVMHSIEMPDGRHYGKKTAEAAVDALSRLDLVGINEYDHRAGGSAWVHEMGEVGDGSAVKRSIANLTFGDMPDYTPSLQMTLRALQAVQAGAKHAIIISDGDAQLPTNKLLDQFVKSRITISTVGVYPHSTADLARLKWIADYTKGKHYEITTQAGLANIVQIFIKEAQTVKRSLIWEGDPFSPAVVPLPVETMRGVSAVPPISGYVVAADREGGPAMVTLRGKENDPILASWQHGLGKVITFTSDVSTRWAPAWVAWGQFRPFWEQHLRWAMRPSGSANVRVTTEKDGDRTRVILDMLDAAGERLNFARFVARVATPDGKGQDITFREEGMGRYVGSFDSKASGSYMVSLRYAAPNPAGGEPLEGSVQAAVTRPFADEYRALTDNTPLLQQVAAMTGGRVLTGNEVRDDLWRREGLTLPVATFPIWLSFAMAGIGVFLLDVGVRRVRIDIPAMARAVVGLMSRSKEKAGQQMDSLRAAREGAKAQIARRARAADGAAPEVASVKFEATKEQLKATGPVAIGGPEPAPAKPAAPPKPGQPKDEGLSRLKQAKQRARDEMKDE